MAYHEVKAPETAVGSVEKFNVIRVDVLLDRPLQEWPIQGLWQEQDQEHSEGEVVAQFSVPGLYEALLSHFLPRLEALRSESARQP